MAWDVFELIDQFKPYLKQLQKFSPLWSKPIHEIVAADLVSVAQAFEIPNFDAATAEAVADNLSRFAHDPEGTFGGFVTDGSLLRLISNKPVPTMGETLTRCPMCQHLHF